VKDTTTAQVEGGGGLDVTWRSCSKVMDNLHACSAVNANDLSVDPLAILGREETNNAGNVDGLANTVVRRPGSSINIYLVVAHLLSAWNVLLAHSVVHVGLDATWGDAVDSDLLVPGINGEASSEGLDGTLRARVDGVLWNTLGLASDGAHQNNAAANLEVLVCLTGNEELTPGVNVENAVELLWRDIFHVAERDDTGVGADNVELAEVLLGLVKQLDGLVNVGNIGLDGNGLASELLDLCDNLLSCLSAVGIVDNDISTTTGELEGHCLADSTAGTSNKGDLALQAP